MTLPTSGMITASMINVELGNASNAPFNLGSAECRALAGKPSGQIMYGDFYGKSNTVYESFTLGATYVADRSGGDKVISYLPASVGFRNDIYDILYNFGSLSPANFRGYRIHSMHESHGTGGDSLGGTTRVDSFVLTIDPGSSTTLPSDFVDKVQVFLGTSLVVEYYASNAVFNGYGQWVWNLPAMSSFTLGGGNTYTVRIHYK